MSGHEMDALDVLAQDLELAETELGVVLWSEVEDGWHEVRGLVDLEQLLGGVADHLVGGCHGGIFGSLR